MKSHTATACGRWGFTGIMATREPPTGDPLRLSACLNLFCFLLEFSSIKWYHKKANLIMTAKKHHIREQQWQYNKTINRQHHATLNKRLCHHQSYEETTAMFHFIKYYGQEDPPGSITWTWPPSLLLISAATRSAQSSYWKHCYTFSQQTSDINSAVLLETLQQNLQLHWPAASSGSHWSWCCVA